MEISHERDRPRLPGAARAAQFSEVIEPERSEGSPSTAPPNGYESASSPPPPLTGRGQVTGPIAVPTATGGAALQSPPVQWSSLPPQAPSNQLLWAPPPVTEKPAEWGKKRFWVRVMSLGMAKAKPGEAELEYRHNVKLIRQGSWPRSARIAVVNPKGGVGKTPTSLVLAGILATHRGGSVAVWDGADAAGTLHSRAEGFQGQPISDVVANPNAFSLPGTIAAAASTQSSLADVLGSPADREFTEDSVRRVLYVLDRTYRISVADTGNVVHSSAYQEILRQADILVVPTIVTADSVNEAVRFISKFHGRHSPLTPTPVVAAVLHHGGPTTPGLAPKVHELLTAAGAVSVVDIPFDPVIGAGTPITVSELSHESTLAWTRLATATVSYLTTN